VTTTGTNTNGHNSKAYYEKQYEMFAKIICLES